MSIPLKSVVMSLHQRHGETSHGKFHSRMNIFSKALEIVIQHSMMMSVFGNIPTVLKSRFNKIERKLTCLNRIDMQQHFQDDHFYFDESLASEAVNIVTAINADAVVSSFMTVDRDSKGLPKSPSNEETLDVYYKTDELLEYIKTLFNITWLPISQCLQHVVLSVTLELNEVLHEFKLNVANFFQRQRQYYIHHECNFLVYQIVGYVRWTAHMELVEQVIFSMALLAGLLETESLATTQEDDELLRTWCTNLCKRNYGPFAAIPTISQHRFVKDWLQQIKAIMLQDILTRPYTLDFIKVIQTIGDTVLNTLKHVSTNLSKFKHALGGSSSLLRTNHQLHDHKQTFCDPRSMFVLQSLEDLFTLRQQVRTWIVTCITSPDTGKSVFNCLKRNENAFLGCLQDRYDNGDDAMISLSPFTEIRHQASFFVDYHIFTSSRYCSLSFCPKRGDHSYCLYSTCEEIAKLLMLKNAYLVIQEILVDDLYQEATSSSPSPTTMSDLKESIEWLTSMLDLLNAILPRVLQSIIIGRQDDEWSIVKPNTNVTYFPCYGELESPIRLMRYEYNDDTCSLAENAYTYVSIAIFHHEKAKVLCKPYLWSAFPTEEAREKAFPWLEHYQLRYEVYKVLEETRRKHMFLTLQWAKENQQTRISNSATVPIVTSSDVLYEYAIMSYITLQSTDKPLSVLRDERQVRLLLTRLTDGLCNIISEQCEDMKTKDSNLDATKFAITLYLKAMEAMHDACQCIEEYLTTMRSTTSSSDLAVCQYVLITVTMYQLMAKFYVNVANHVLHSNGNEICFEKLMPICQIWIAKAEELRLTWLGLVTTRYTRDVDNQINNADTRLLPAVVIEKGKVLLSLLLHIVIGIRLQGRDLFIVDISKAMTCTSKLSKEFQQGRFNPVKMYYNHSSMFQRDDTWLANNWFSWFFKLTDMSKSNTSNSNSDNEIFFWIEKALHCAELEKELKDYITRGFSKTMWNQGNRHIKVYEQFWIPLSRWFQQRCDSNRLINEVIQHIMEYVISTTSTTTSSILHAYFQHQLQRQTSQSISNYANEWLSKFVQKVKQVHNLVCCDSSKRFVNAK